MIDKYDSICVKILDLISAKFNIFVYDKNEVLFGNYEFTRIISSGISKFEGEKIYIDTASVDNHKIVSSNYVISHLSRPSRANMQPIINSTWLAKLKDSPKFMMINDYSKHEIDNLIFSTGFLGLKSSNRYINSYLYTLISSKYFQERKNQVSVGATMQSVNNDVFNDISVPDVEEDESIQFGESVDEMYKHIYFVRKKIENLKIIKSIFLEMFFS